jgi:hypothetical protein
VSRRRCAAAAAILLLASAEPASAHGLVERADLPLPGGMFFGGAVVVLALSFLALAALWRQPLLQQPHGRRVLPRAGRALTSPVVDVVCGAVGIALLALVLWSAFWGTWPAQRNFAAVFVFVVFWVGLVPASVLFGDVYRLFNPWRAIGRAFGWTVAKVTGVDESAALRYPEGLGYWPAAAGLLAFGWLELAHSYTATDIGIAVVAYSAVQFVGMSLYGAESWTRRADAFAVYFELLARLSPWRRDGRELWLRRPLSGLATWPIQAGSVGLFAVIIGTVTFDGFSRSPLWQDLSDTLVSFWSSVGLELQPLELPYATGLVGCVLLVGGFYALGIAGIRSVSSSYSTGELRRLFIHTLGPIALAYAGAHYFTLLAYTGQSVWAVISDPIGRGWDLFGTASSQIDFSVISTNGIWWVQLVLVIGGHACALALAHDRALALFPDSRLAVRSQYWLLGVMVGFTTLALWLLHTAAYNP